MTAKQGLMFRGFDPTVGHEYTPTMGDHHLYRGACLVSKEMILEI